MTEVEKQIEALYKDKYGQLISSTLQRFRSLSVEMAEDVVQEAFAAATGLWPKQGKPENPSAWLYQVCKNKSINLLKKVSRAGDLSLATAATVAVEEISEPVFKDAQLLMLLAC